MIVLQRGDHGRKIDACPGKGISIEIGCHSKGFFAQIKDRPFTPEERAEISSRFDSLERDINRVW